MMRNIQSANFINDPEVLPEKRFAKAVLIRAFLDSVGHIGNLGSMSTYEIRVLKSQAYNFISTSKKRFRDICELADANPGYIVNLHSNLTYQYSCGKLKDLNTRYVVERLFQKL